MQIVATDITFLSDIPFLREKPFLSNIDGEMNLFILVVQGVPPLTCENNYSVFLEHCAQKVEVWKYRNRRQGHEIQVM